MLESAGVGVWLDRVCVYGSLGEQVNPSHMRVHCAGVWRVSSVRGNREWSVCAREMDESRNVRRTPYGFGVWCATAASHDVVAYISDHVHPSSFRLRDRDAPPAPLAPPPPPAARQKDPHSRILRRSASASSGKLERCGDG